MVEFASDVNVRGRGVHRATDHQASFDEFVGVLSHDFSVLARPGFALVGVDDKVSRALVLFPAFEVHE